MFEQIEEIVKEFCDSIKRVLDIDTDLTPAWINGIILSPHSQTKIFDLIEELETALRKADLDRSIERICVSAEANMKFINGVGKGKIIFPTLAKDDEK